MKKSELTEMFSVTLVNSLIYEDEYQDFIYGDEKEAKKQITLQELFNKVKDEYFPDEKENIISVWNDFSESEKKKLLLQLSKKAEDKIKETFENVVHYGYDEPDWESSVVSWCNNNETVTVMEDDNEGRGTKYSYSSVDVSVKNEAIMIEISRSYKRVVGYLIEDGVYLYEECKANDKPTAELYYDSDGNRHLKIRDGDSWTDEQIDGYNYNNDENDDDNDFCNEECDDEWIDEEVDEWSNNGWD